MEFNAILEKDKESSLSWYYHIILPEEVVAAFEGTDRRVLCQLNDEPAYACAIMPKGDGTHFIMINKERRKKLGINIGEPLKVKLKKDDSKYGMPVPEEFEALFEMDDEAQAFFDALTPGKQRVLLHLIAKPKRSETRLKKAIVIYEYLKSVKGKLDFKELNEAFKSANRESF